MTAEPGPTPQDYGITTAPSNSSLPVQDKPPSVRSLLGLPVIRAICVSQWMLGFLAACFNTGFVLMAYTPIEEGGLSMNVRYLSVIYDIPLKIKTTPSRDVSQEHSQ